MRHTPLILVASLAACSGGGSNIPTGNDGTPEDSGGSQGDLEDPTGGSGGKKSTGGDSGTMGGAGGEVGGTDSSGGSAADGGSPGSGGKASGGSGSGTGGAGTGGTTPAPDACDPPALVPFEGSGNDLNNVCGWTNGTAPAGYGASSTVDCGNQPETGMFPTLAKQATGVWRTPYVSIIDPADACSAWDRTYFTEGYFCMRISSPFDFSVTGKLNDGSLGSLKIADQEDGCMIVHDYDSAHINNKMEARLTMGEVGWVQVETAEIGGGNVCPLTCQ